MELRLNTTPLKLRKYLGILGILLPFILVSGNRFEIEPSISHYYYTGMSVIFTGILFSFGLFLFSYRGYDKAANEKISDNMATNFAGILAILTAVIPTTCLDHNCLAPNGHDNQILEIIHAACASGFFIIMGWMSYVQFTKDPLKLRRNQLYRLCGIVIWATILILASGKFFHWEITKYDVFIGETIALLFFGTAWLVKGETLKKIGF